MTLIEQHVEAAFGLDELFFSTTDKRWFITSANSVFFRIAEYEPQELIGKPHNIIRHPDMPRVVFQLLWDMIQSGKSIAAYVKNRSKSGKHYWVIAVVRLVQLTVRLRPSACG